MFEKLFKRNIDNKIPVNNTPEIPKEKPKQRVRRFAGAGSSRTPFQVAYTKINNELKNDYIALVLRARDCAKNNSIVVSYLNFMQRNVLGAKGFSFSATSYLNNNTKKADVKSNRIIDDCWYDYCTSIKKYVSADEQLSALDFDRQILNSLLIDGEVFIHRVMDKKSKYGIRYEIIDALDVDTLYNQTFPGNSERICMGIKVNEYGKPLSYFVRRNNNDYYNSGERIEIPAKDMIHLYKRQFAGQIRGYTPLASILLNLKALEEYNNAEINAALLNAAYMGIWEKTGSGNAMDNYNNDEVDDNGNVAVEVESNVFRFAPDGYTLKSIQSQHPNNNLGAFNEACIKCIASSLGVSSNKLNSDYNASYSALQQANKEDQKTCLDLQQFLIDNWKNVQYADWLKQLLISDITPLKYTDIDRLMIHDFRGNNWEHLDPAKELAAAKIKLEARLSSPQQEIEKLGGDVDDVLNDWKEWENKLAARGLSISPIDNQLTQESINNNDDENTNQDKDINEE